jgi:WD40 repeat protein
VGTTTIVFDVNTGKERWRLRDEESGAVRIWLSADGRRLAVLRGTHQLDIYDIANGKQLFALPLEQQCILNAGAFDLALSADGETVALAGPDAAVYVWCARDRKWRTYGVRAAHCWTDGITCLAFSPDASRLVVGSGADLQVVDVATMMEVQAFDGHRGWVDYVAFAADGKRLLTGSAQHDLHPREVATWDTATWKRLQLSSDRLAPWRNVGIASPEHSLYLGKEGNDRLNLYGYATGKPLGRLQVPGQLPDEARGFFAPGSRFFVSFHGWELHCVAWLYDIPSGKLLCELPRFRLPSTEVLRPVAFSADSKLVAVFCLDGTIALLEPATGKHIRRLERTAQAGQFVFGHLVFSPDGKHLASWNLSDQAIHLWDLGSGKKWLTLLAAAPAQTCYEVCFVWSPDGRMFAVGAEDKIYVWELATQKLRCVFRGHEAEVRCLAFSPDSRLLASGSIDTTVLIWDVTGRLAAMPERARRAPHRPPA